MRTYLKILISPSLIELILFINGTSHAYSFTTWAEKYITYIQYYIVGKKKKIMNP